MDKEYVLDLLRTTFNNYMVGCLAGYLISEIQLIDIPDSLELNNLSYNYASVFIDFKPMKILLSRKEKKRNLLNEHMKSILRSFVKDSFEISKLYAKETNQLKKLKKAPWYNFIRIIRNCLAHNFRLNFNEKDKKTLPVEWNGIEITVAMDGKPLQVNVMNETIAMLLFKEVFCFIEKQFD